MLGHRSATRTLDLYSHLLADQLDEVADAMDAARDASRQAADEPGLRLVESSPKQPDTVEIGVL